MKKFIIGALVLLIGVPGFSFNFFNFLNFLAGLIPVLMILGGAIAVYLGIEELKQSDNSETEVEPSEIKPAEIIEKNTEKSDNESERILDKQEIKPEPEPTEKTVETNTDEQAEPEIEQASESPATLTQQPAESLAPEAEAPADERVQFKGNIETLVFHSVTCNFASGKNCSMDFTTKEEAQAQGYKPCKICIPDA
ncbi:MAG TPA: Ada metal-binding domain-containing protein [Desulfobacter sp.]|nr:Ada metal-binding domain-containing protein [Desulfobacter sp.]